VLPADGPFAELDAARATSPCVLETAPGELRMWYSGHDGTTGRVVGAVRRPGRPWERTGTVIDAGFHGDSDDYEVGSPSVVRTRGGYLMAYAGFDGEVTRLHMASSADGRAWTAHGPFLHRERADSVAAEHPCLLVTAERWWLYYSGCAQTSDARRWSILGAVSDQGSSWDRLGPLLAPDEGELAASEPCVSLTHRRFRMLYTSTEPSASGIAEARSLDGVTWQRHGLVLPADAGSEYRSPFVLRLSDGTTHLWYAVRARDSTADDPRLWEADQVAA
jgi:predicted GH43/DUF377 family glycosyl hydrolase